MKIINTLTELDEKALKIIKETGTIKIPENVDEIGREAFAYCNDLKEIVIPANIVTIKEYAFSHCINLKKITLCAPTKIESVAFTCCPNLEEIYITADAVLSLKGNCKNYISQVYNRINNTVKITVEKVQPSFNIQTSKIDFVDYIDNEGNTY